VLPFAIYSMGTPDSPQVRRNEPATFYPHAIFAILPLQFVALGALGAVIASGWPFATTTGESTKVPDKIGPFPFFSCPKTPLTAVLSRAYVTKV